MNVMKPQPKSDPRFVRAAGLPASLRICGASEGFALEAAAGDGKKLRRFAMTAYTGAAMSVGLGRPVVVDLEGLSVPSQNRPILSRHDAERIIGHTDRIEVSPQRVKVGGVISGVGAHVEEVIALADNGFAWQASLAASVERMESVERGETVKVNGRTFNGPLYVARASTLQEVSFVPNGADPATSTSIAAQQEAKPMNFEQWLAAQGFDPAVLQDNQRSALQAAYRASQPGDPRPAADAGGNGAADPVAEYRGRIAAEARRVADIRRVCAAAGHPDMEVGEAGRRQRVPIEAHAVAEGWDITRTELEVLRATRPKAPATSTGDGDPVDRAVIEAAFCLRAKIPEDRVAKWYGEKAVDAATTEPMRKLGLVGLFQTAIRAAGKHVAPGGLCNADIRAAFEADRALRASGAGYSTISLSGILSNVANKALLDAYNAVATVGPRNCAQSDVSDFKQVTRYRLTGQGTFEKVGPDGELKHAQLTEEAYTNQLETYGKMITLTRTMIINDELEAFLEIPRILGRQSALAVESAVFTLLLSNPGGFFSAGNKNLSTGAGSALQISALTTVEQMFADQTDKDGKPILLTPAILLVPTSLKVTAQQLMTETRVNETTTAGNPKPANNPHAGKWQPLASPYLNSQGIAGGSPTAWYLLSNPADVAAMEIVYLRGQRTPTVESGETDFDTLGMKWRGYFDFGVGMQDFRAAVKAAGA
jgi:hypothetical protein